MKLNSVVRKRLWSLGLQEFFFLLLSTQPLPVHCPLDCLMNHWIEEENGCSYLYNKPAKKGSEEEIKPPTDVRNTKLKHKTYIQRLSVVVLGGIPQLGRLFHQPLYRCRAQHKRRDSVSASNG